MIRKLGLSAVVVVSLGACSFHASVQAGSRTASKGEQGSQERSRSERRAAPDADRPESKDEQLAARDQTPSSEQREQAPAAEAASPAASPAHDHDRGHGNDADGVDEDNPGKSKASDKALAKADKGKGDHDRGHGNDADGVDEDNPGKSKGKKAK